MESNLSTYILREPKPGDMGAIISQNGKLYYDEYDWNIEFEGLVAGIVSDFIKNNDPKCEKCWIADINGKVVGSIFVVRHDENTAKLRILYVDSSARGLGIGTKLVNECIKFAQEAGYKRMILWTNSVLVGARKIYDKAGFKLESEENHFSFGKHLVGQVLSRDL